MRASGLVGLWWGVGHTLTLMMGGAVVLISGIHIPEPFALLAESGVGFLLVVLGGTLALKLFRERWHLHSHVHDGEPHVHLHSHQNDSRAITRKTRREEEELEPLRREDQSIQHPQSKPDTPQARSTLHRKKRSLPDSL